jgi:hypothetical protein
MSERNSEKVSELVNESEYMYVCMNDVGMLVGRKEGRK